MSSWAPTVKHIVIDFINLTDELCNVYLAGAESQYTLPGVHGGDKGIVTRLVVVGVITRMTTFAHLERLEGRLKLSLVIELLLQVEAKYHLAARVEDDLRHRDED